MNQPPVTLIIPVYNEELYIRACTEHVLGQTYPSHLVTILLVDGHSEDNTRSIIEELQTLYPERPIHLLDNPKRGVAAALNIGVQAATTKIILRMDAHSTPAPDFIEASVRALQESGAAYAGGSVNPVGTTSFGQAAAEAWVHPFVSGGAKFRTAKTGQYTDTVFLGAFDKTIFDKAGLFNEALVCNEDYEMNIRIRKAGGKIFLDPRIQTTYTPRATPKKLWDQYFRYGWWKVETLRLHPDSLRWRQLIPFLFVLVTLLLACAAPFFVTGRYLLAAVLSSYCLVVALAAFSVIRTKKLSKHAILLFPFAVLIMHVSWGSGFLLNLVSRATFPFQSHIKKTNPTV